MGTVMLRVSAVARRLGGAQVLDDVSLDVCGGDCSVSRPERRREDDARANRAGPDAARHRRGGNARAPRPAICRRNAGSISGRQSDDTLIYLAQAEGVERRAMPPPRVARWLDRVDMTHAAGRRVEQLSKGQQQKIQIATAFIGDPGLLVLDEPFTGLDPLNTRLVCDLARDAAAAGRGC